MTVPTICVFSAAARAAAACWLALALLSPAATAAQPAPAYACLQEGHHQAKPPMVPVAFDIKECASFSGGAQAGDVGQKWCDAAAKAQVFPWDPPPKVKQVGACPGEAKTLCTVTLPDGVVMSRYHYVVARDGLDKMQQRCEAAPPGMPKGRFVRF
jgi:hypothetical protein